MADNDAIAWDRLQLRRAALAQISGTDARALENVVKEQGEQLRERRDRRFALLKEKLNEIQKRPDE